MDWRVGALIFGAGLFGLLVVAIFAGAARVSMYEDMERGDELQPIRPEPPAIEPTASYFRVPPYVGIYPDPEHTEAMPAWQLPKPATVYESKRAQQP